MIDTSTETLRPFQSAGSHIPGNRSVHISSLHRWRLRGVRGVKLETVLVGGTRYTSDEAISRFIAAQNADQSVPSITPHQRQRQSEAARKELEKLGI